MGFSNIKFKKISKDEAVIMLDRLSRFKLPDISYERFFYTIISKYLLYPKYSAKETENLPPEYIASVVKKIWNASVEDAYNCSGNDLTVYNIQKTVVTGTFKNISEKTKIFLNTKLKFGGVIDSINPQTASENLRFLKSATEILKKNDFTYKDLCKIREKYSLKFPISKLIIVEGITEEILLPVFAKKLNRNFNKEGIFIAGAGGKSKSPGLYSEYKDKLRIPVTLLFDADAKETVNNLNGYLLKKDKSILIKTGEFEDILSVNLIKRVLNKEYEPATPVTIQDLREQKSMCKNIEKFYRTRHVGEFKKSGFAKLIASEIKYPTDITQEIKELFNII